MKLLLTFAALLVYAGVTAQVGIGTTTPNPNAVLELKSPGNNQGFLVPRLTTIQRTGLALAPNDNGLLVFDSDDQKFYYWQNTQWLPIKSGNDVNLVAGAGIDITGNTISAVPDADGDASNEIQDLQLTGNTLTITNNGDATPIDLSPLVDADGDATNEIQDLQLTGNNLKITNNATATTIDLSPFADADGDPANEIQDLQLVGNTLSITNNAGATAIDLAPFAGTNTDNQSLSFNTTTGVLDITGGNNVTLNATGAAGGVLSGTYPNPGLIDNAITSAKIVDGAIATTDLADLAVTTEKLGDVAVTTGKLVDNAITTVKMSDNAVTSAKIANGTVVSDDIADGTIATLDVADAAVTTNKLNNLAVTTAKLGDASVSTAKIADGAVTGAKLEDIVSPGSFGTATAVPQFNLDAHGRVTSVVAVPISGVAPGGAAGGVLSGTYPNPSLVDDAITSAKIAAGAVANNDLADLAVSTGKLADNAITTIKVADNAVTSAKILNNTIASADIADGTILSADIADGTIATADVADASVTTAKVNNLAITMAKLADASVSTAKIADGAVTGAKLEDIVASPGSFGTATAVPQLNVDVHGRVTSVTPITIAGVAPGGAAGGLLSGTYPNPGINTAMGNALVTALNNAATTSTIGTNKLASSVVLDSESPTGGVISGTFGGGLQVNDGAITSAKILDGTIATGDLANSAVTEVKIADGAVTGQKLENIVASPGSFGTATAVPQLNVDAYGRVTSVTPVTIAGVAPGGAAGGLLSGTYPNPGINTAMGNALVTTLNDAATTTTIATGKLASSVVLDSESPTGGAISGSFGGGLQVNDGAITSAKILDGTIATGDLANSAVNAAKIADGAVTGAKLENIVASPGSFGTATAVPQLTVDAHGRVTAVTPMTIAGVAPGGAANGDLAGTYPSPSIAATAGSNIVSALNNAATTGAIAASHLDASIVLATESPAASAIAGSFASGLTINDNAVTSAKILDGAVGTNDLANTAVTTAKLGDGSVSTIKISDGAVTNAKISGVDPSKITPSGVLGQVLTTTAVGTVWSNLPSLGLGTVTNVATGSGLTGGPITGTGTISIANGGVTATHIADGTITNTDISATAGISVSKLAPSATNGQVLTTVSGVPTWSDASGTAPGLAEVLNTSGDAKNEDAFNLNSVTITNAAPKSGTGALNVTGSHFVSYTLISADYTVKVNDYIVVCNGGKPVTVELPKAAENTGRILMFRSNGTSSAEALTLNAADGLDGQGASEPLYIDSNFGNNTAYALTILSIGNTWITISRSIGKSKG